MLRGNSLLRGWHRLSRVLWVPGGAKGQAGWGPGQPALVGGKHAHCREVGTGWYLRSLTTQTILRFYEYPAGSSARCAVPWELQHICLGNPNVLRKNTGIRALPLRSQKQRHAQDKNNLNSSGWGSENSSLLFVLVYIIVRNALQ